MFETEEKIAFGLLVAVLSIIGAAVIIITYMGTGSFATQYTSTLPDGTLVQFQGHVEKVSLTKAGDHQILTITGVQVFAPTGDTQVNEGDAIAVTGIVQSYKGKREILVNSLSDIRNL